MTARREGGVESPMQIAKAYDRHVTGVPYEIRRLIQKRLDVAEERVTLDASFLNDLGADSLALVDLTLAIEETFDIEFPDDEADKIRTVRDAVNAIDRHLRAKRPS
jgi:acyl carrier protein